MDQLDNVLEKIDRLGVLERIMIRILLTFGILAIAFLTPGLFSSFGAFGRKKKVKPRQESINRTIENLIQKGLVIKKDRYHLKLSGEGMRLGQRMQLDIISSISSKKHSKNIYTIISYDIPENKRAQRKILRDFLREVGCVYFHQSFWVFEGEILEEVQQVRKRLGVQMYVFACLSEKKTFLKPVIK